MGLASGGKGSEAELLMGAGKEASPSLRERPARHRVCPRRARHEGSCHVAGGQAALVRAPAPYAQGNGSSSAGTPVPLLCSAFFPVLPADLHPSLLCCLLRPLVQEVLRWACSR